MTKKDEIKATKKEEPKKDTKKIKIIIAIIAVIILIAIAPFGIKWYKESKSDTRVAIQQLKDEIDLLEKDQQDIFMNSGFSDEYYEKAKEIDKLSIELVSKETGLTVKYTILPIIIIGITVVTTLGILLAKLIAKSFDNITFNNQLETNKKHLRAKQQKVVLDVIDRRNNEETKIKALKCPSCKANISHDATKCEYCGTSLVKVKK